MRLLGSNRPRSGETGGLPQESREDAEEVVVEVRHQSPVKATRLFDKLDQLERKWQSQKTPVKTHVTPQSPTTRDCVPVQKKNQKTWISSTGRTAAKQKSGSRSGRDQPELTATFSVDSSHDKNTMRPHTLGQSGSFASINMASTSVSVSSDKSSKKKKKGPRLVSMFDRLYQKGKTKAITRTHIAAVVQQGDQTTPNSNSRNKRRQKAATVIQSVFRGAMFRKQLRYLARAATVIQRWWELPKQRLFYLRMRGSVLIIQSLERRRVALCVSRERYNAVVTIQCLMRVRWARNRRTELVKELERRIQDSNSSSLMQNNLRNYGRVVRQHHVDCASLMLGEEAPSDDEEDNDDDDDDEDDEAEQTPSNDCIEHIYPYESHDDNDWVRIEESPSDEMPQQKETPMVSIKEENSPQSRDDDNTKVVPKHAAEESATANANTNTSDQSASAAASLYRAAQLRRRKMTPLNKTSQDHQGMKTLSSPRHGCKQHFLGGKKNVTGKHKSIAYQYLPTNKSYWHYDAKKLALIPVIQSWAREQLQQLRLKRASVKIQCAWRIYRSQFHLISLFLLKEWSVRVDFYQEETTNNPILRQKVRLLALTRAIRQVNDECLPIEVGRTPNSFVVNWATEASIYFAEDHGIAQLNRCRIHVTCAAHRHPLWEAWSSQKKFTHLSKTALMKSFANQCARLSRASVLLQSLKMRRILWKMAQEKGAATIIQRFWRRFGPELIEVQELQLARKSAIRIQAFWRMIMAIDMLEIQEMSACSIQASYRGSTAREEFWVVKSGMTRLQASFRGLKQRNLNVLQWQMAIQIQGAIRGFQVRSRLDRQNYAALRIQDWYRAVALRVCMSKIRLSYSILQCLVQRQAILSRLQQEQAAVRLQAWFRMISCESLRRSQLKAVVLIQALYHGRRARKIFRVALDAIQGLVKFQAIVRSRNTRIYLCRRQEASDIITDVCLAYVMRKRLAATRLQAWLRMTLVRSSFTKLQRSTVQAQLLLAASWRRFRDQKSYRNLCRAQQLSQTAIKLQAHWRKSLHSKKFATLASSAIVAQKIRRGYQARKGYQSLLEAHKAARIIQLAWDDYRDRNATKTFLAIVSVQRIYRGYQARRQIHPVEVFCRSNGRASRYLRRRHSSFYKRMQTSALTLQTWSRATTCRRKFLRRKAAPTTIQACFRGWEPRRVYRKQLNAATKIQAWRRMTNSMEDFEEMLVGSIIIQAFYRGFTSRCVRRSRLKALVVIQSIFRMRLCVKRLMECRSSAATNIQALYRGFRTRVCLQHEEAAAYVIQQCFQRRQLRHGVVKHVRFAQSYKRQDTLMSDASVSIHNFGDEQSAINIEYQLCSILTFPADQTELSATLIATTYRAHVDRKAFEKTRVAVNTIQKCWRMYASSDRKFVTRAVVNDEGIEVEQVHQIQWLKKLRTFAAILVQTWFRTVSQRSKYRELKRELKKQTSAAVVRTQPPVRDLALNNPLLQKAVGAAKAANTSSPLMWPFSPELVLSLPISLVSCLESVRMPDAVCTGDNGQSMDAYASKIQVWWSSCRAAQRSSRNHTSRRRSAAHTLGSDSVTRAQVLHQFRLIVLSTCLIQASWRRKLQRILQVKEQMATRIESLVRRAKSRELAQRIRCVVLIQKHVRGRQNRCELYKMTKGFRGLLHVWSVYASRPDYIARIEKRNSGLASFQMVVKASYQLKTASVRKIQRKWRLRRAAVILQRHIRMFSARASYTRKRSMAIRLQSKWRGFTDRYVYCVQRDGLVRFQRLYIERFTRKTMIALLLQKQLRMKKVRGVYHKQLGAAECLQKNWRKCMHSSAFKKLRRGVLLVQVLAKHQFDTKTENIILIQRHWRMISQRMAYGKICKGMVGLQRLAVEHFITKGLAITVMQKHWRMYALKTDFSLKVQGAVTIQKFQRRFACRTRTIKMRNGFLNVQERWRKKFERNNKTAAAILLQRAFRRHSVMTVYRGKRLAAITLQSYWRRFASHRGYLLQLSGFSKLQMHAKGRHRLKISSVIAIQQQWRMFSARLAFKNARGATIVLQTHVRGLLCRSAYEKMIPGFISLQVLAKLWFRIKNTCAVTIQTSVRRVAARKRFQTKVLSAVNIQRAFRGFVQRRNLSVLRWLHSIAATMIAATYRMHTCRRAYTHTISSVIVIQDCWRAAGREHAAIKLQAWWRCVRGREVYLLQNDCATAIAWAARLFLDRRRREHVAARKIQRSWADSKMRFIARCLLALRRAKSVVPIQRWWRGVLLSRYQKLEEQMKKAGDVTDLNNHYILSKSSSSASRSPQGQSKTQSCGAASSFCYFDLSVLSTGLPLSMPWGTLADERVKETSRAERVKTVSEKQTEGVYREHLQMQAIRDEARTARELARKNRSARLVQRLWRKVRSKLAKERYYQNIAAAWIQCVWRGHIARERFATLRRNKSAAVIQNAWRRQRKAIYASKLQAWWRMDCDRRVFLKVQAAAMHREKSARKIQHAWWIHRIRNASADERKHRLGSNLPAMVLQAGVAWILSDPRVLDYALKGGGAADEWN